MARPGLTRHRKFVTLALEIGSRPAALGHLELLWQVAYESGDDLIGSAAVVESLVDWSGEPGKLAAAFVSCGFLDESTEGLRVHDLWDHAPDYVRKRRDRERERKHKGKRLSGRRNSQAQVTGQCPPNGAEYETPTGQCPPNGRTPAPAPAPAPAQEDKGARSPREAGAEARMAILGREATFATAHPRTAALLAALEARGTLGEWPVKPASRTAVESAIGAQDPAVVAGRVAEAIRATSKPWLGNHLDVIRPPPGSGARRVFVGVAEDGFTPVYRESQ